MPDCLLRGFHSFLLLVIAVLVLVMGRSLALGLLPFNMANAMRIKQCCSTASADCYQSIQDVSVSLWEAPGVPHAVLLDVEVAATEREWERMTEGLQVARDRSLPSDRIQFTLDRLDAYARRMRIAEPQAAEPLWRIIYEFQPQYVNAAIGQARIRVDSGDLPGAQAILAQAIIDSPDQAARLLKAQADLYMALGLYSDAAYVYETSLDSSSASALQAWEQVSALVRWGDALRYLGQPDRAFAVCSRAIDLDGTLAAKEGAYLCAGLARCATQSTAALHDAMMLLMEAEAHAPSNYDKVYVVYWQAYCYAQHNDTRSAIDSLERGLGMNPGSVLLLNALGELYYRAGMSEEARDTLRHVIELDPGNEQALDLLSELTGE